MPPPILSRPLKTACVVLQVVPLPGVGAIIAGWRNPHTGLLGRGISQLVLVVFGSWPLIVPGAIGLVWAAWDAVRLSKAEEPPPWSTPTPDAPPETVATPRQQLQMQRQQARAERREARQAAKQERQAAKQERQTRPDEAGPDDETRWMP